MAFKGLERNSVKKKNSKHKGARIKTSLVVVLLTEPIPHTTKLFKAAGFDMYSINPCIAPKICESIIPTNKTVVLLRLRFEMNNTRPIIKKEPVIAEMLIND